MEQLKYWYRFLVYVVGSEDCRYQNWRLCGRIKAGDPKPPVFFRRNRAVCLTLRHIVEFCSNERKLNFHEFSQWIWMSMGVRVQQAALMSGHVSCVLMQPGTTSGRRHGRWKRRWSAETSTGAYLSDCSGGDDDVRIAGIPGDLYSLVKTVEGIALDQGTE